MNRKFLKVRVETVDGDVSYFPVTSDIVYLHGFNDWTLDRFALQRLYFPEYRIEDLICILDFFDEV